MCPCLPFIVQFHKARTQIYSKNNFVANEIKQMMMTLTLTLYEDGWMDVW